MSLIRATEDILNQLTFTVNHLSSEEFTEPLNTLNNSTIGQHFRHTIEFFHILINAVEAGMVNYDNRNHDKTVETNQKVALKAIEYVRQNISIFEENVNLELSASYTEDGIEIFTIPTNLFRELAYNIEHAVHHMAIIKIGLLQLKPSLKIPKTFGVAVSTIRHQSQTVNR